MYSTLQCSILETFKSNVYCVCDTQCSYSSSQCSILETFKSDVYLRLRYTSVVVYSFNTALSVRPRVL